MTESPQIDFSLCLKCDVFSLKRRLKSLTKISDESKKSSVLQKIMRDVEASQAIKAKKLAQKLHISFPENLPVSQKKDEIAKAIAENQVVIIAGETGSGKTTQIPKICLELGRGVDGIIGHTQPRRIAARSVADRIAQEMQTVLGQQIGFKVRFNDKVSDHSLVKLMTDGILLAEIQNDRYLSKYDTIIIDEAHERSLNIDFLLGYLKQLLPKRKDLKLIITSATIDQQKFAAHFNNAPIIEVSGRTFPVETRYRPVEDNKETERDQIQAIFDAVDELTAEGRGDILIFMNGEREIRDTAEALTKRKLRDTEIIPLFARLSVTEQNKIFQSHSARRIVLATNVAETSLTVPGIKYVIDPGTARISRYSYRTKVQRLPIEPISQASANQRQGRCGRVSEGICIRLYSEEDFDSRQAFTDPEILRTNLGSVILQMLALGLGEIEKFPFVQPPDNRNITDGIRLLEELEAVHLVSGKNAYSGKRTLTKTGRLLARFPIDPRLAKMVVTAAEYGAVHETMVITAALSIQDPRERPSDARQKADASHERFANKDSDFIAFLNLWDYLKENQREISHSQFRKLCKQEFLAYMRVREWQDVYTQLKQTLDEQGIKINTSEADYEDIHRSLLSGLLSHIGFKDKDKEYKGARNSQFFIFPGSSLHKKQPKWVIAAELVETSKLFGRVVAKINPEWIEPLAEHLVKRSHAEPRWDKKRGNAIANEQVYLYGIVIVNKRTVQFNKIDPYISRQLFVKEGLVESNVAFNARFLSHNQTIIKQIEELEHKSRRRDLLVDTDVIADFYDSNIPDSIVTQVEFLKWYNTNKKNNKQLLCLSREDLLQRSDAHVSDIDYPDTWKQGNLSLKLDYSFDPGANLDGISVQIPLPLLNQVEETGFDWGIPGLQHEYIVSLIKSLPKTLRKNFVPAPNYAEAVVQNLVYQDGDFLEKVSKHLLRMTGVRVEAKEWNVSDIPSHLRVNFCVLNEKNKVIAHNKSLSVLQNDLVQEVQDSLKQVADSNIEKTNIITWDFGNLPKEFLDKKGSYEIKAFPALVDNGKSVSVQLLDNEQQAHVLSWEGIRKLILLNVPSPIKYLQSSLPNKAKLGLYFNPFGQVGDLISDCISAAVDSLISTEQQPRTEAEFEVVKEKVRAELGDAVVEIAKQVEQVLSIAHRIKKKMKGKITFDVVQAYADINKQLEGFIFKGFVTQIGESNLANLSRYLLAIEKRLEKLPVDPHKDKLQMLEVEKAQGVYSSLLNKLSNQRVIDKQILDVKWMIEELRVSLFAQALGTPYPISSKRIINKITELEKK